MSTLIKQTLLALGLALAASTLCNTAAVAAEVKKPAAKAKARAKAKPVEVEPAAEPEPDITDTTTTEFECELGNKVTTYHNANDDSHLAVRWKKRVHRLDRVGTTTGAKRFENKNFGLIWIGIPAKGMLLDSKLNRQLANECKNAEQMKPPAPEVVPAAAPVAASPAAPVLPPPLDPAAPPVPPLSPAPQAPVPQPPVTK